MATKSTIRFGLTIHEDRIVQSRSFDLKLWDPVMRIIEGAPMDVPTVFEVGSRSGLEWPFQGDPHDLAEYLTSVLKDNGYANARVELADDILKPECDPELSIPEPEAGLPEPEDDLPEPEAGLPGPVEDSETPSVKKQLKSLRQAWSAEIMPRPQAIRRVAQIVRSKGNGLSFGDGALDALIRNIEGLI
ncbi:MAG: hypothetical protein ACWGQW_00765 [bacterium]